MEGRVRMALASMCCPFFLTLKNFFKDFRSREFRLFQLGGTSGNFSGEKKWGYYRCEKRGVSSAKSHSPGQRWQTWVSAGCAWQAFVSWTCLGEGQLFHILWGSKFMGKSGPFRSFNSLGTLPSRQCKWKITFSWIGLWNPWLFFRSIRTDRFRSLCSSKEKIVAVCNIEAYSRYQGTASPREEIRALEFALWCQALLCQPPWAGSCCCGWDFGRNSMDLAGWRGVVLLEPPWTQ